MIDLLEYIDFQLIEINFAFAVIIGFFFRYIISATSHLEIAQANINLTYNNFYKSRIMDNNIKQRIDEITNEISNINDLNIKHACLTYMEQQAAFMLWQMEDEKHIDNDSYNV